MSNTYARCPMEKSEGQWTFHLSNGYIELLIFHWAFACPFDPMDHARCPMEKSEGQWTFHLSNGSIELLIFHWAFACPFDPMDMERSIGI